MKIHKPCVFYLLGVFVGMGAMLSGPWLGTAIFFGGGVFGLWLDIKTKQM